MVADRLEDARALFEIALKNGREPGELAVAFYDLGSLEARCENLTAALDNFEMAIEQGASLASDDSRCSCLLVPRMEAGKAIFQEVRNVDLMETALEAKRNIEELLRLGGGGKIH